MAKGSSIFYVPERRVCDFFRTDWIIRSHLQQHPQMYVECLVSGSEVLHTPCLIGETRQTPKKKSPVWKQKPWPTGISILEAGLGENGKDCM